MGTHDPRPGLKAALNTRPVLILLVLLVALFLFGIGRELVRRSSLDQQFADLERKIAELEAQNAELTSSIAYFQTDTYREEQARLKLGFAGVGEKAVTVPLGKAATGEETHEAEAQPNSTSNVTLWLNYFFSKGKTL